MGDKTDIAVIGAGPAGLIAAREAAKHGIDVTIFEEDDEVGVPCHCAGILSLNGLKEIEVPLDDSYIQNRVRGARFLSPSKLSFTVERSEPVACVVDRSRLDKLLVEQAVHVGARLKLKSRIRGFKRVDGKAILVGDSQRFKADVVIDAEGVSSHVIRDVGLQPLQIHNLLPALQYDLTGTCIDRDYVEIHTGRELAPQFFAWVIPLNENSVRVGLGCKGNNPQGKLERFIKDRFERENLTRTRILSGLLVTTGPIPRTFHDNFISVGDVAGQVKPTTGGGVIWGGICAMIAGETAAQAVKAETLSGDFLWNYETMWREKLGKEVSSTLLARRILSKLSDRTIDKIFEIVKRSNVHRELSAEADMDFQASSILRLIKKKDIFKILASSTKDLIRQLW